jgi:alpha-galactosidase
MHRTHEITFRAINALFGHAGIEWNVTEADERELKVLKSYVAFYKKHRDLLHSGDVVRSDVIVGGAQMYGTVAKDKKSAIFSYMQLTSLDNFGPLVATFDGLDAKTSYTIEVEVNLSAPEFLQKAHPGWWPKVSLRGDELATIGLQLPVLKPENGLLFTLKAN